MTVALTAAALATLTGCSGTLAADGGKQPTATHAATTARPAAATPPEFISKRYAFRVTLTKDWTGQDASLDWDGKKLQGIDSPAFADFTDPGPDRTLVVAAAPVATGMHLAAWRAAMVRAAPSVCTQSRSAEKTTLGGEPALTWPQTCTDGFDVIKLATLHGS